MKTSSLKNEEVNSTGKYPKKEKKYSTPTLGLGAAF
jgi:hypothetical protein